MNTGLAFVFAIIFSYVQLLVWAAIGVFAAVEARKIILGRTTRRNPTENSNDRRPVMNTALWNHKKKKDAFPTRRFF